MFGHNEKRAKKNIPTFLRLGLYFFGFTCLAVLLYAFLAVFNPARTKEIDYLAQRGKNAFLHLIWNEKPRFYQLVWEKNGIDESLKEGDALMIGYRDEFVIKELITDALTGRGISVDVEGLGDENDYRRRLEGTNLVDATIRGRVKTTDTKGSFDFRVLIKYQGEAIAVLPIIVELTPQDWLRHARRTNDKKEQINFLKNALEMNGSDTSVRKTLAALYESQNQTAEAIQEYRQIINLAPKDLAARRELLKIHLSAKDYSEAIQTAQEIIKLDPNDNNARHEMATAYINQGKLDRAIAAYQEILKTEAANPLVHYKLGELHEKTGNLKKAIEHYQAAQTKRPKDRNIMIALAEVSIKAGNHDEAIKWLTELIKLEPKNANLYALLGMSYSSKGMIKEEIDSYQRSLQIKADNQTVRFNLAVAYEKNNMDRQAANAYQIILNAKPADWDVLERLANCLFRLRDFDGAITHYEKLDRLAKKSRKMGHIYLNMAYAYGELEKYPQSAERYEAAIKQGLQDPIIYYNLAVTYGLMKNNKKAIEKKAIEAYEKYAARQPTREVLDILAQYYMDNNQFDKAVKTYLRLVDMETKPHARAAIYSSLGYASSQLGNTDRAIEYYRLSLKFDSQDDEVYFSLGEAYEKKQLYQEARQAYLKALEYNHQSTRAKEKVRVMGVKLMQEKFN